MKIIIIDDERYKYENIADYIRRTGETNISWAKSRNSGLRQIREAYMAGEPYDLVVCDNYMPIYDDEHNIKAYGMDIVNHLRARYDDSIFICMSSSADLPEGEYDYSITYNSSIELSSDFNEMIQLAKSKIEK